MSLSLVSKPLRKPAFQPVAWARRYDGDTSRLGITGFCWGGRVVWLYSAHSPALKAGVAWYGRLVGASNPLQPRHPVELAPSKIVAVHLSYPSRVEEYALRHYAKVA